jgi:dolichol-phosphate mannosyltransferase
MSLSALNRGYRIAQIPIQWHGRTWGSSNLKLREMGRRYLATLVKMYAERMLINDDLMADLEARRKKDVTAAARPAEEPARPAGVRRPFDGDRKAA